MAQPDLDGFMMLPANGVIQILFIFVRSGQPITAIHHRLDAFVIMFALHTTSA